LTKHTSSEEALKCPLDLDEVSKVSADADSLMEKNMIAIGGGHVSLVEEGKVEITLVKAKKARKRSVKRSQLDKVTKKLYDLEPCSLPEKPLHIELDLYQMEDY
jgi:hypothetical protein